MDPGYRIRFTYRPIHPIFSVLVCVCFFLRNIIWNRKTHNSLFPPKKHFQNKPLLAFQARIKATLFFFLIFCGSRNHAKVRVFGFIDLSLKGFRIPMIYPRDCQVFISLKFVREKFEGTTTVKVLHNLDIHPTCFEIVE